MLPYKSLIALEKPSKTPIFLQITNGLMDNIKSGLIFQNTGSELVRIRVDDKGLDVEHLAEICKKNANSDGLFDAAPSLSNNRNDAC